MKNPGLPQLQLPKLQASFEQRQIEHLGFNPVHQQRVEKAFDLKQAKTKMNSPQPSKQPGSPWLSMGEKK